MARTRVPPGHKILTRPVAKGEPLRKYNQIIGFATDDLAPGTHVHTHNCVMGDFERAYAFCADAHPTERIQRYLAQQGRERLGSIEFAMKLLEEAEVEVLPEQAQRAVLVATAAPPTTSPKKLPPTALEASAASGLM